MCVCVCVCVRVCLSLSLSLSLCVCMFIYLYIHVHVYIYVKVCDLINCASITPAAYPEAGHAHAFVLSFFDHSSITFAAATPAETQRWTREVQRVLQMNDENHRSLSARAGI